MSRSLALLLSLASLVASASIAPPLAAAQELELADPTLHYEAPRSEPRTRHRMDQGLVSAGATLLSIGWTANAAGSALGTLGLQWGYGNDALAVDLDTAYGLSLIPVVGPMIWGSLTLEAGADPIYAAFAFTDAAIQVVGFALLVAGLVGVDEPIGEVADGVRVLPVASLQRAGVEVDVRF